MIKAYRPLSTLSIILSLFVLLVGQAGAVSILENESAKTATEIKKNSEQFMPIYQGKCERNPNLPGC